jgi:hypothetical protein
VPAIANAIFDACGVWMNEAPFTPDRVLKAIERRDREARRAAALEEEGA